MNRLTYIVLDVRSYFKNTNYSVKEIVYIYQQPYCLEWFEISYLHLPTLFLYCLWRNFVLLETPHPHYLGQALLQDLFLDLNTRIVLSYQNI